MHIEKVKLFLVIVLIATNFICSYAVDDGGRCPVCGRYTLKGSSHFCKPQKKATPKNHIRDYNGRDEAHQDNYKSEIVEFDPKSIKAKKGEFNLWQKMDSESREWKDAKGKKINALWTTCEKNESSIWLQVNSSGKYLNIPLSRLSAEDVTYVKERIAACKNAGKVWNEGCYFSQKDLTYIDRAMRLVLLQSPKTPQGFKMFQILPYGGLAKSNQLGLFYISADIAGLVGDTDIIAPTRLFWASTYSYTNEAGSRRVVNCYTINDFVKAVTRVRMLMGLYTKDDPHFADFEKGNGQDEPKQEPEQKEPPKLAGFGSGFFITQDGYFITNFHVVDGAAKVFLKTGDEEFVAKVLKTDKDTDLALLKAEGHFESVEFSPLKMESLGQDIFTMGYPQPELQGMTPKVTKGVISGLEGFMGDVSRYQIDASIQPGNSGGPVADENGYIVGVVVSYLKRGNNGHLPQNVNYAIKKSYLMAFLDSIPGCVTGLQCPSEKIKRDFAKSVANIQQSCALVVVYE